MLSPGEGVAAAPGREAPEPGAARDPSRGESGRSGVQEWSDGSRYEGEFVDGLKHGAGRYSWTSGECYEGSFYKDYRHGDGCYCWPSGHKFTGKFYLNRKEGYGHQVFPDGAIFEGLYHADQRLGPGVMSYADGRQDVGLWAGERLIKLCTVVEESFSLRDFAEYAAFMDPASTTDSLIQSPFSDQQKDPRTNSEVDMVTDLLSDETFILPPGLESYSTDGDHLPLPPGRRRELDQQFFGELWEPDIYPQQGYERDPLSNLPLQARMCAHIHKHRLQAENVGWDVAAVLSLNREGFGPKGPLEVSSELLIHHASCAELQAVSQILQTGLVHPDVTDSQGHTALIAATVNCQNDVIQLLLDVGVDIDKLNCEGMSALAVCHVLYYPFQSLHTTLAEPLAKQQFLRSSVYGTSPQISQVDSTTDMPGCNNRPQTGNTTLSIQTSQSHLFEQTAEDVCNDTEPCTERLPASNDPETPGSIEQRQEEEGKERRGEAGERYGKETETEGKERGREEKCGREDEEKSSKEKKDEEDVGEGRETKSRAEITGTMEEVEEDVEKCVGNIHEEVAEEAGSVGVAGEERSIQVLDGHIALGSLQWKERGARRVQQGKVKQLNHSQTFDSDCSVISYNIQVTEEVMQRSAEALSRTGIPQRSDTQETVRRMAAMKTEHRVRLNTLKLLLDRGADPNVSRVPMPVLFLAIMAADSEVVRRLLLCGARTDIPLPPERKGLYPLHVAAALPGPTGPTITELLLHAITDPDAQACDQDEIYEADKIFLKAQELGSDNVNTHLKEGGRTALHVACQRESDYQNASKVVALLLSHRASTDLLWSGHSPLSLAIAAGNDLAVEELLKGGADPNIPLGRGVGSALCALSNIHYHLGGNRTKLLDMLAQAGADILMPVVVGEVQGTAVDYAHYSFKQDSHIANTPFHALNMRERETFKARRQLLSMMVDLLRHTAGQRDTEKREHLTMNGTNSTAGFMHKGAEAISSNMNLTSCGSVSPTTETKRGPVFKFCCHCGRSVSVKLTMCNRCQKVFFCSKTCKLKAWEKGHKDECVRASASPDRIQKCAVLKPQRASQPLTVMLKSKVTPRPLSVRVKSQRAPEPFTMAEKVSQSQANLNENYSFN